MVVYPPFSMGDEAKKVQETIRTITPISDMIPVIIPTIRYDVDNVKTESQSVTKGTRRKYRYDLEPNPKSMLANLFYEIWFLSVGLNDSDPSAQQYGIWFFEIAFEVKDEYYLYVFSPEEQYLLWKQHAIVIKNIGTPINKLAELEKQINFDTWIRSEYVVSLGLDPTGILMDEAEDDARNVRIVSFHKEKDDDFCLKVESPKSKSVFTFIIDKKWTEMALNTYNSENNVKLKTPPLEMVRWKMKGFTTPAGTKTNKQFRTWFFPSENGEYEHIAKFIICNGENVILEKKDGQTVTIKRSKLSGNDQQYIKLLLEAEKPLENKKEPSSN
jgi:hypothetical protein